MKNVKVYKQNQLISDQNLYEDPTEFVNHIVGTNYFGKPIRWVRAKLEKEFAYYGDGRPNDGFWFPDEHYDDEDVLETEEREVIYTVNEIGETVSTKMETWVKLKAEYTIEIEDVTQQIERDKRIAELKKLLSDSDWTQIPDVAEDKGAEYVNAWKVKRKAWRDEIGGLT